MNELIKVHYDSADRPTVWARDLYDELVVPTPYDKWFDRMCKYGFVENVDFVTVDKKVYRADGAEMPQTQHDHQITIPMAKELCMLQRTDKGKQMRQYFIAVEEQWNSPDAIMARALQLSNAKLKQLQVTVSELTVENQIMKPKAEYFDDLVDRNLLTGIRETAKEFQIKQKDFVTFLMDKKYLYRDKKGKLMPYAKPLQDGLFELKETKNDATAWSGSQTMITPKGRETFRLLMTGI